jgi:hypothetical protein
MGGSVKKKYQAGGPKPMMKPTKIATGTTKKGSYEDAVAKVKKSMVTKPKKQMGGVIPEKPIATAPIQGRLGQRAAAGSNMAKGGQTFPDLNKDGKITKADVLKGRGVFKKGGAKKYQGGGQSTIEQVRNSLAGIKNNSHAAYTPLGLSDKELKEASDQIKVNRIRRDAGAVDFLGRGDGIPLKEATRVAVKQGELAKKYQRAAHPSDVLGKPKYLKKKGGQAHPGFKAVQAKIAAKQGVSKKAAGAILAASTRKASAKAKAANPRLKRVKG